MNYKPFPIGVHVDENSVKVLTGIVQNDNANLFQVQLYDSRTAFNFSGYTIINATIVRPDGTTLTDAFTDTVTGEIGSHTFVAVQRVEPESGRITLQVGGEATEQTGLYRMALEIYADDVKLTTARINYHVVESLDQEIDESILTNSDSYTALQNLLTTCSNIINQDRERANQEASRVQAEEERAAAFTALATEMRNEIDYAVSLFNEAIAAGQIDDLKDWLVAWLSDRLGILPMTDNAAAWYLEEEHQEEGAMVGSTGDGTINLGWGGSFFSTYYPGPPYVADDQPPAGPYTLWIDTGNGGLMKYYDSEEDDWLPVKSVAVFG